MDTEVSEALNIQPFLILAFCFFMAYTYVQRAASAALSRDELGEEPPTVDIEQLTKGQKDRLKKIMKRIDGDMKEILDISKELEKVEKKILEKSAGK